MIEWCAMISVLGLLRGLCVGRSEGGGVDLEGGVGRRDEKEGAFFRAVGVTMVFLKSFTSKSLWLGMWRDFTLMLGDRDISLVSPRRPQQQVGRENTVS